MNTNRTRSVRIKPQKAVAELSATLATALRVAESAVAELTETQTLLARSLANADRWRQLCEAAQNRSEFASLCGEVKPVNEWVN